MFGPHYYIDSWQKLKHNAVVSMIKDETVQQEVLKLIDAQTQFYHSAANVCLSITESVVRSFNPTK